MLNRRWLMWPALLLSVVTACAPATLPLPETVDPGTTPPGVEQPSELPGLLPAPGLLPSGPSLTLPDASKTPGDILTTDLATICTPGYTATVRNVPQSLKNAIYASYGIVSRQPYEYEIDHLVSLELGGNNSVSNLWPQSYITTPLNARTKDGLENRLHDLACKGTISLVDAQREIALDWTAAFIHYVGPLPTSMAQLQSYGLLDDSDRDGDLD
jgi:hypothetical protein